MLDDCLKNYTHGSNRTLDALSDDPKAAAALFAELDKLGLRNVSSERLGGTTAIVVQSAPGEVLRICKEGLETERDANDARIWQPARDLGTLAGYKTEIYAKANPLDKAMESGQISTEEAFTLTKQLVGECAREGKLLWDLKPDNLTLAKDKNGRNVLFVLDEGALAPMAEMHKGVLPNDNRTNIEKFRDEMAALARSAGRDDAEIRANPEGFLVAQKLGGQDVPDRMAIQKSAHAIYVPHENKEAPMLTDAAQGGFVARWKAERAQKAAAVVR